MKTKSHRYNRTRVSGRSTTRNILAEFCETRNQLRQVFYQEEEIVVVLDKKIKVALLLAILVLGIYLRLQLFQGSAPNSLFEPDNSLST